MEKILKKPPATPCSNTPALQPSNLAMQKEAAHDCFMPESCHNGNDPAGKFVICPSPGMDSSAERNWPDLWGRNELREERQRSFAAFQCYRVVVDAVDREKIRHWFYTGARKLAGEAKIALHQRLGLLLR